MDDQAAGVDWISALPDDMLHVILGRIGYAPAVSKTAVLSRRWRHVWTRAKSLTFKGTDRFLINKSDFAGFVDWVLAHRRNDMESLEICVKHGNVSPDKANEWLRYAAQHVVISVDIGIEPSPHVAGPAVVELPSHVITASISLHLPHYRLRLPAAARYEALTNLELSGPLDEEGGSTLGDFVASCCPRLRQLDVMGAKGLRQLVLRSDALEVLDISTATDLQTLEVVAPNLRVVRVSMCFLFQHVVPAGSGNDAVAMDDNKLVRIAAPKLEEIRSMDNFRAKPSDLDIHDLTGVRRLTDLSLRLHGKYHRDMDVGAWLLEKCPGVEHVDVWLEHDARCELAADEQLVDLTSSEGNAPFAKLRTMAVRAHFFPKHHFVASMSSLLSRCPNLSSLSVKTSSTEVASRSRQMGN
nr:unnamed protein product [Digitaria exilis]